MIKKFENRADAGQALAKVLSFYKDKPNVVILALPRGGVPVAYEVATALSLPLDVWLVRKLGIPGHEEFAMGAIAEGGVRYLNTAQISQLQISEEQFDTVLKKEEAELARRSQLYRGDRKPADLKNKTVILIDDGMATGSSMHAAIESLSRTEAARIVVAVPVGARATCLELDRIVDDMICLITPEPFFGVGQWYTDFTQTSDQEVRSLLTRANTPDNKERPDHDKKRQIS